MKLWLTRFGKILAALRNEGLFSAFSRTIHSLIDIIRFQKKADILMIASGTGDSARYRCHHSAEFLRKQKFTVSLTIQGNVFLLFPALATRFRVILFHRTSWTPSLQKFLDTARNSGTTIIFDTDDLVFDVDAIRHSSTFHEMNILERNQYIRGVGTEFVSDERVAFATTPTAFLAERLRSHGKHVFIIPNRLCDKDVALAEELFAQKQESFSSETIGREICIGYFSGSKGHDRDFSIISNILIELLGRYPSLRLFLAGVLTLPPAYSSFEDRIDRSRYVPRAKNFANMARVDIAIAPLEIGDPFCESKSELKFFEAGIVGTPIVASATDTFRRAITDGEDGFIAATSEEWRDKLTRLIQNRELRRHIGMAARLTTLARYTTDTMTADDEAYTTFLKKTLQQRNPRQR